MFRFFRKLWLVRKLALEDLQLGLRREQMLKKELVEIDLEVEMLRAKVAQKDAMLRNFATLRSTLASKRFDQETAT